MDGVYICMYCGEENVIVLELLDGEEQEHIEDCTVCCNPNHLDAVYNQATESFDITVKQL